MPPAPLPQERDNPPSLLVFALCTGFRAARHRGPEDHRSRPIGVMGIEAVVREHDRFTRLHTEANRWTTAARLAHTQKGWYAAPDRRRGSDPDVPSPY